MKILDGSCKKTHSNAGAYCAFLTMNSAEIRILYTVDGEIAGHFF